MAAVDVTCQADMAAPPEAVAKWMFDPLSDPLWMDAVKGVEVIDAGLAPGAKVRRKGKFLGNEIAWTSEVIAHQPGRSLQLRLLDGPFTGVVTYEIEPAPRGSRVRIRNTGEPGMFAWMPGFLLTMAMRTALKADLKRLAELAERGSRVRH